MRFSTLTRPILALSLVFPNIVLADAADCPPRLFSPISAMVDRAYSARDVSAGQKLRNLARQKRAELDAADLKIERLQNLTRVYESQRATDAKNRAYQFEILILLGQMQTVKAKYGLDSDIMGRNYFQVLASEAHIEKLKSKLQRDPVNDQIKADIASEEKTLKEAKRSFVLAANRFLYLQFILEIMEKQGLAVVPQSLFEGTTSLTDADGNEVKTELEEPSEPRGGLESIILESSPESAGPRSFSVRGGIAMPKVPLKEEKEPTAAEVKMNQAKTEEIKKRAKVVRERFGHYFETEAVRPLREELAANGRAVERPSYVDFKTLFARLSTDPDSMDGMLTDKKATIQELSRLRWRMAVGGPALTDSITEWLGSIKNGRIRKALKPLGRLAGMNYDTLVQKRHGAKILQILANADASNRIGELIRNSADSSFAKKGELIVTFIRFILPDNREAWADIIDLLKESTNSLDHRLKSQLDGYMDEALARGALAPFDDVPDYVGLGVQAATAASATGGLIYGSVSLGQYGMHVSTVENFEALLHALHLWGT